MIGLAVSALLVQDTGAHVSEQQAHGSTRPGSLRSLLSRHGLRNLILRHAPRPGSSTT